MVSRILLLLPSSTATPRSANSSPPILSPPRTERLNIKISSLKGALKKCLRPSLPAPLQVNWIRISGGRVLSAVVFKLSSCNYNVQPGWRTIVPEPNTVVLCLGHTGFFWFFKFIYFILFLAVLGLRFCARAFSSCGERGPLFIAGATLHHGARASHYHGLSCCGAQAPDVQAQ